MEGLNKFREAFEVYSDNYVIIGGTACEITMTNTVMRSRATHDIDMIVIVEKMTADFCFKTHRDAMHCVSTFERKTRLELATPTLARLCSTN